MILEKEPNLNLPEPFNLNEYYIEQLDKQLVEIRSKKII